MTVLICTDPHIYIMNSAYYNSTSIINDANIWETCEAQLSAGRSHHSAVVYNNTIWLAGGLVNNNNLVCNSVEMYNTHTNVVTYMTPIRELNIKYGEDVKQNEQVISVHVAQLAEGVRELAMMEMRAQNEGAPSGHTSLTIVGMMI